MIRRLLALFTGRAAPARAMPVSPVPQLPSGPRVARRLDPPVRLDRMSIAMQREFWRRKRRSAS